MAGLGDEGLHMLNVLTAYARGCCGLVLMLVLGGCCALNDSRGNPHIQTGTSDCWPFVARPVVEGPPQRQPTGEQCQTVKRGSIYETICTDSPMAPRP